MSRQQSIKSFFSKSLGHNENNDNDLGLTWDDCKPAARIDIDDEPKPAQDNQKPAAILLERPQKVMKVTDSALTASNTVGVINVPSVMPMSKSENENALTTPALTASIAAGAVSTVPTMTLEIPTAKSLFTAPSTMNGSGYSPSIVDLLLHYQGGRCFVCGVRFVQKEAGAWCSNCSRDHEHGYGHANFLICSMCNTPISDAVWNASASLITAYRLMTKELHQRKIRVWMWLNNRNWPILRALYTSCSESVENIEQIVSQVPIVNLSPNVDVVVKNDYEMTIKCCAPGRVIKAIMGHEKITATFKTAIEVEKAKNVYNPSEWAVDQFVDQFITVNSLTNRVRAALREYALMNYHGLKHKVRKVDPGRRVCHGCNWSLTAKHNNRCVGCQKSGYTFSNPCPVQGPWKPLHPDFDPDYVDDTEEPTEA